MNYPETFDAFFQALTEALKLHDWRILAGLCCIALVAGARWGAGKIPGKFGAWIKGDQGGAATALLIGIAGSFGRALFASKDAISAQFILDGVVMGVTAAGGFSVVKKLFAGASAKAGAAAALALFMTLPGCAWLKQHPGVAGALDCGLKQVEAAIPGILSNVASALAGGSPDWKSLGMLEAAHGIDTVECAAMKLLSPPAGAAANPNIVKNAKAYLADRGRPVE